MTRAKMKVSFVFCSVRSATSSGTKQPHRNFSAVLVPPGTSALFCLAARYPCSSEGRPWSNHNKQGESMGTLAWQLRPPPSSDCSSDNARPDRSHDAVDELTLETNLTRYRKQVYVFRAGP